jgi:hypothetical protein
MAASQQLAAALNLESIMKSVMAKMKVVMKASMKIMAKYQYHGLKSQ